MLRSQQSQILLREARGTSLGVDQDVKRLTRRHGRSVLTLDFIAEPERAPRQLRNPRAYDQFVFISSRVFVAATRLGDDQKQSSLAFHVTVGKTAVVAILAPTYFKPNEVIRVVGNPHLIGLRIPHPRTRLGYLSEQFFLALASLHALPKKEWATPKTAIVAG